MYGVFDRFLPGNLPKWKNQSIPTNTDPMWSDLHLFVAAALQPFVRSREHKKRRCPFASTPFQVEVARRLRLGWRYPINPRVILLIGTLLWNNIKMISCIIYIYMSYLYLELYVYLFLSICTGGYLCQSLCAAGRQSKSSTPKIKCSGQSLHPQRMEHAIYLLSSV